MAIQTRIAPHFGWKYIIMAVVCLVLGVWGIYDYVEVIPSRLQAHERGDTTRAIRDAIIPGADNQLRTEAKELLEEERQRFSERYPEAAGATAALPENVDQAKELAAQAAVSIDSLRPNEQAAWATSLDLLAAALADNPVPETEVLVGTQLHAFEVADRISQHVTGIKRPSFYDRPTQWAFILCLPFVPWALWVYVMTRKQVYRLEDDGSLHLSEAAAKGASRVWSPEEIKDIDMSQWMRKSIAWVEHSDGTRIKLDDYKHKNLHLIVGAIASRLYPEQWDAEAKPVKAKRGKKRAGQGTAEPENALTADNPTDEPAEKS